MLNRVVCFFIVLTLLFSCNRGVGVTTYANADNPDFGLIYAFGIWDEAESVRITTRVDFARMIANILSLSDVPYGQNPVMFADVAPNSPDYNAVSILNSIGIMNYKGESLFLPNKPITKEEAAIIAAKVLNFAQVNANKKLDDNADFYSVALMNGILKNVNFDETNCFDTNNALVIVSNILNANIVNDTTGGSFIKDYLKIYRKSSIVTDDGVVSVEGESSIKHGYISSDGTTYLNKTSYTKLFGKKIRYWWKEDEKSAEYVILYIDDISENLVIKANEIDKFQDSEYTFYKEGSDEKETAVISKAFNLVYNERLFYQSSQIDSEEFKKLLVPKTGSVELIDIDKDGEYDVVRVMSYKNIVVGSIFEDGSVTMSDKLYSDDLITIPKNCEIVVKTNTGSLKSLSAVGRDNVVSVAISNCGKYAEIILGRVVNDAEVDEVSDTEYNIDGKTYNSSVKLDEAIERNKVSKLKPGLIGKMYLNFDNEIVGFIIDNSKKFKYAMFGDVGTKQGISKTSEISFYTEDNNYIILTVPQKVKIDGVLLTQSSANTLINNEKDSLKFTLVMIKYNEDKELIELDLPYVEVEGFSSNGLEDENSIHIMKDVKKQSLKYLNYVTSYMGKFSIDNDTKVFMIADNAKSVADAYVSTYSNDKVDLSATRTVSAYSTEKDAFVAEAMIMYGNYYPDVRVADDDKSTQVVVVKNVSNVLMGDETVYAITVTDGYYVKRYTSDSIDGYYYSTSTASIQKTNIGIGDIIKIGVTDTNKIPPENITLVYDCSSDIQYYIGNAFKAPSTWNFNNYATPSGYIYRSKPGYFEFTQKDPSHGINYSSDTTYVYSTTNANVLEVERDTKKVNFVNADSLISYKQDSVNYSKVYLSTAPGEALMIVIYK